MNNIYEIRNVISKLVEDFNSVQNLKLRNLFDRIDNDCNDVFLDI